MALAAFFLTGCGGGEEGTTFSSPGPPPTGAVLAWDPPVTYVDDTALDPTRDLDYYEFYVREDVAFTDADPPLAQVAAVTDVLSQDGSFYLQEITREFVLDNLAPFAEPGTRYYLSIRAVGVDGLKSDFSAPVVWDLS